MYVLHGTLPKDIQKRRQNDEKRAAHSEQHVLALWQSLRLTLDESNVSIHALVVTQLSLHDMVVRGE
jgi:hypothetical protein